MTRKTATLSLLLATTLIAGSAIPAAAHEAGQILVRLRGIAVVPDESGSTRPLNLNLQVNNSFAPEVDVSYFLTKNIAFELIAATTKHTVQVSGKGIHEDIGSTWVLPPTLTAQYHFFADEPISPYLGAGVNYTIFYGEDSKGPFSKFDVNNAWGGALQAGFDFQVPESNFVLNLDFKYIFMSPRANVHLGNTRIRSNNFDLNPMIFGAGIGYKF
ncbi:MAG: outer membrane beta-barrel protein [Rhodospirillales bacterium]|jgi:outer membrane protein|nr:outer membrane beta-barrel protein [Rhodospirillales bacterium]